MKPEFWLEAWQQGKRGFHSDAPHADLQRYAQEVFAEGTVLVPLCGASVDLAWLAEHGFRAVGVELSPVAVQEVVARDGLRRLEDRGPFEAYGNERITLLQGNYFDLEREHLGPLTGIWDRAALVAMHPDQRVAYTDVHKRLLDVDGNLLLNVLDYDASKRDGPPWAVSTEAVAQLWPGLELLDERTDAAKGGFAEVLDTMTRRLYRSR